MSDTKQDIKRYDLTENVKGFDIYSTMEESEDGDYVLYEKHKEDIEVLNNKHSLEYKESMQLMQKNFDDAHDIILANNKAKLQAIRDEVMKIDWTEDVFLDRGAMDICCVNDVLKLIDKRIGKE